MTKHEICLTPVTQLIALLSLLRTVASTLVVMDICFSALIRDLLEDFKKVWHHTGLSGGNFSASPMQVLAAAGFRTCEFDPDRVYSVMQIFGDEFQVGKARVDDIANDAPQTKTFTRLELEDELGGLLLKKYPPMKVASTFPATSS